MSKFSTSLHLTLRYLIFISTISLGLTDTRPADAIELWLGGQGDIFAVSSDLYERTDNIFAGGLNAGFHLGLIGLYAEALMMESEQYLITANMGAGLNFGDTFTFGLGAFTGPMLFIYPEAETPQGVDLSRLSDAQKTLLLSAGEFSSLDEAEAAFDPFGESESELNRLAFGWNLLRVRADLSYGLFGPIRLGLAGQVGYHLLISGQDTVAGAKNQAIDAYALQYNLPNALTEGMRDAMGAEPIDSDGLNGFNYDINFYLRFQLGI
jgi:hypothetical protein